MKKRKGAKKSYRKKRRASPLCASVDLCFYFTEEGVHSIDPEASSQDLPVNSIQGLPLIVTEPCKVSTGKFIFKVNEEGFYRFCVFPESVYQCIYFGANIPRFVGSIAHLNYHGWRDEGLSQEEFLERARRSCPSVCCAFIRSIAIRLFSGQGIAARPVSTFTMDQWNNWNDGHSLFEYMDPAEKRWILADPDFGYMFRSEGRWLDVDEVCRLVRRGGDWEMVPVSRGVTIDTYPHNIDPKFYLYAMAMTPLIADIIQMRRYYERIFQVPQVGNDFTVDTPDQKERFIALCSTANLQYDYIAPSDFRGKYYPSKTQFSRRHAVRRRK